MPVRSLACSCIFYEVWGFVDAGGLVPSNSRGLLWVGDFEPSGIFAIFAIPPVEIVGPSGEPLPVEYEFVSGRWFVSTWLFRPRGGFEAGRSYTFVTKRVVMGHSLPEEIQRINIVVSEKAATAPVHPIALSIGEPTTARVPVPDSSSCSDKIEAVQLPVRMELPEALEEFRDQLYFETIIDSKDAWRPSLSACDPYRPGVSWRGKGVDLLFTACGNPGPASTRGLAAGRHTVEMRASLPGTNVLIASSAAVVELRCRDNP